jgi:hypothetical protein
MTAALAASLWRSYATHCVFDAPAGPAAGPTTTGAAGIIKAGTAGPSDPHAYEERGGAVELMLLEVGSYRLCGVGVGERAVLVLVADDTVELGLLKLKAASVQATLYGPMAVALRV